MNKVLFSSNYFKRFFFTFDKTGQHVVHILYLIICRCIIIVVSIAVNGIHFSYKNLDF